MDTNAPQNITYYSKIADLCFYVLGNDENLQESNISVTNKEVMKGDKPMLEGVYDPHLGTTDYSWLCQTCGNRKTVCPGHFGTIDLKYPVKSPMFRDELLKWLKIICYHCGEPVVPIIKSKIKVSKKLSEMVKNVRAVKQCPHCKEPHLQVVKVKETPTVFYRIQEEKKNIIKEEKFFNHQIEQVVQKIRNEVVLEIGKPLRSHPSKFILRTIRVPPNTIRPDLRRIGGARSSNSDTTSLLKTIVEINEALPDEIPEPDKIHQDLEEVYFNLDMAYYVMIKGGGGGDIKVVTNTNKPPVAIAEHFPKKTGRIRRNLMGKRVEYMIRSVITGDSRLKIDEVGVALMHARNIEIPETVTKKNRDRLMVYFMNKDIKYPGCKRIIKKATGKSYRIHLLDPNYQLQEGDVILRDMIDGDYICFNRQPSLLFSNIAGMRVVVMHVGETLRINPSVCNLFNADFDGDQMNSIVPQSIQSRNECMSISKVARWVISPQIQSPMVGAFQDGLIGLAELTKDGLNFNKWHAMSMLADINDKTVDYKFTKKNYNNRELVSRLLPEINVNDKHPSIYKEEYASLLKYNPKDIKVNIIRGELQSGIIDKNIAGQNVMGSIFHTIANEYGNNTVLDTIFNLQQIVHRFLLYHGFTVGIYDINISETAMKEIKRRIASMISECRKITNRLNYGKLIAPLGTSLKEYYEAEQLNALEPADDFVFPIFSDININNNSLVRMILTGSKGKPLNFISINGAIGKQSINGKRFLPQCGWGRTSPYFVRYDTDPDANGYVATSYREGITSDVYAFTAAEARHGQISNALSTSITGNQNRISIKNLETIIIDNLRKSVKGMNVIQPLYGECGLDPAKTEKVKFPTVMISDNEFENSYKCDISKFPKQFQNNEVKKLLEEEFIQLKEDREKFRQIHLTLENNNPKDYIMTNTKQVPVNIPRIIDDIVYHYADMNDELSSEKKMLNPLYHAKTVKELCDNLGYVFLNEIQRRQKKKIPKYIVTTTNLMQILIRSYLCSSYLLKKGVGNVLLDIIIQKIVLTYKKALVDYGSPMGILAAQCISEPMTQFILDSKHRTGGQGGTKTNEIVRIQEILGAKDTEIMKNPHMLILTKPEYETDKLKVQEIANHIEMVNFERFISSTRIFFEEYGNPTHPDFVHEAKIIKEIEKYNYGQPIPTDLAKWCIRYELSKEELIMKSMKLETIIIAIKKTHPEVFVVYSPENADVIFIRCYLHNSQFKQTANYYENVVLYTSEMIKTVIVRGVKDIISTSIVDMIRTTKESDGSLKKNKMYGIYTVGTNTNDLMSNSFIDPYKTQSDSIVEIERVFGIVAARNKIINEMVGTLTSLNRMHCSIFADEMTFSGIVTSIQKTGLQKREMANITLRLSFQTPVQVIQEAAINGLVDHIGGVSGPLIMGTSPNIGTTYNQIIRNEQFIKENTASLSSVLEDL